MTPSLTQRLADALDLEFADRPRVATLATADITGTPHARSVILRRLTQDGQLWIVSDARSQKNHQLRTNPRAELVFYLTGRKEQFRLLGHCTLFDQPGAPREEAWQILSDQTRALFLAPAPGTRRVDCDVDFPQTAAPTTPIPASFELIVLAPREVDHVRLTPWPHTRTRYRADQAWQPEELNP